MSIGPSGDDNRSSDGKGGAGGGASEASTLGVALAKLALVVAAFVAAAIVLHGVGVLIVVLALVVMVMTHELAHFVTAKLSGMKVTEYFFGFGPRLWSVRRGETTYGVKALPAGGYVKIVGMTMLEDVDPADETRSYRQATFPRRVLVASAGSISHFLLAFALVWSAFALAGVPVSSPPTVASFLSFGGKPVPAQLAGFHTGDVFVSINGRATPTYSAMSSIISKSAGKRLDVVVRRNGRLVHLVVTPVSRPVAVCSKGRTIHQQKAEIGVELSTSRQVSYGPITSVSKTTSQFGSLVAQTFSGLAQVFSLHGLREFGHQVATAGSHASSGNTGSSGNTRGGSACAGGAGGTTGGGSSSNGQILSFLGAIELGSQVIGYGVSGLLLFLAAINLFVGVANMFPMLPLDG
ncbi:MAG TPA: site-2 protease family protein, partial [Acidimicrobiales bacterium]|nr:site-2 protease family protein [Acidimicrobiales bacterium]